MPNTNNLNIRNFKPLISPHDARAKLPISKESTSTVADSRKSVCEIIMGEDKRKILIVGPCSIHEPAQALEYTHLLLKLQTQVADKFLLIMRTYFEKPRTTTGWKGLINDPRLDDSFHINNGLMMARKLLGQITELGMPVATESLDPITPQYLADYICWTAIGARTTESQTHREMSSGLSCAVGFKNNTDGNIKVAINAIKSSISSHHFLGIDELGQTSIVKTAGNPLGHLILRGGKRGPNYSPNDIKQAIRALKNAGLQLAIIVDCSHDNSGKDYLKQPAVLKACLEQIKGGQSEIIGFMIESNLNEGNQKLGSNLKYGVSITDSCLSFEQTKKTILDGYDFI